MAESDVNVSFTYEQGSESDDSTEVLWFKSYLDSIRNVELAVSVSRQANASSFLKPRQRFISTHELCVSFWSLN